MMVEAAKSWVKENATLIYFLIAQAIALGTAGAYGLSYMVQLESRVNALETRGSPHLSEINTRLTVLESKTANNNEHINKNDERIDRIVTIMTKELHISPSRDK